MTLTGTNSWVLRALGAAGSVVVDPGPLDEPHLSALAAAAPRWILLTHGHSDHVEGVARLAELTGAKIAAVDPALCSDPSLALVDGAEISAAGLTLTVLATPGHTADSACFLVDAPSRAVLTGDTILGQGSTIVAYPDGSLADYLASLRKLAALGPIPALPGHGPALAEVSAAADHYLRHRESRLEQVRAAVAAGARTAADVVAIVYADTDPALRWAAERSVQAQLDYLATPPGEEVKEQS